MYLLYCFFRCPQKKLTLRVCLRFTVFIHLCDLGSNVYKRIRNKGIVLVELVELVQNTKSPNIKKTGEIFLKNKKNTLTVT